MAQDKTLTLRNAATVLIADKGDSVADVGFTTGGIRVTKTYTTSETTADQTRFPLYTNIDAEKYEINFRMLQISTALLKEGWGEAGTALSAALSLGEYVDTPASKEIQFYATRRDGKLVKFTFYDCQLASTGAVEMNRTVDTAIECTYTALYDDDQKCCGLMEITS